MDYRLVESQPHSYLECLPEGGKIESERDALDLVAACGENGVDRVLFYESNLTDDFFNLHSGLVGAMFLKFSNYRVIAAAVISKERVGTGRFYEMVLEENRGRQFHVAQDREEAVKWITTI